jgi:hypothetical protein
MLSQAQIDANRLNSQKSTGPTSPVDKAASSLNALKSGVHAQSHIIPGEDPAALDALTAAFLLHHQPADPNQLALVDTLIAAEWTQRRLRRIEAELWNSRNECLDPTLTRLSATLPNPIQFPTLGHSSPDALDPFIRIQRRIDGTNRMYLRTLQVLQNLQVGAGHARPEQAPGPVKPAPEQASTQETKPLTPPNGFVPPFTPASGERPRVRHENHESPSKAESSETGRAPANQALSQLHDSDS